MRKNFFSCISFGKIWEKVVWTPSKKRFFPKKFFNMHRKNFWSKNQMSEILFRKFNFLTQKFFHVRKMFFFWKTVFLRFFVSVFVCNHFFVSIIEITKTLITRKPFDFFNFGFCISLLIFFFKFLFIYLFIFINL